MSALSDKPEHKCPADRRQDCSLAIQKLELQMEQVLHETSELRKLFEKYVTLHEFTPVQRLVYGGAGLALVALISAVIATVIHSPGLK